MKKLLLLFLLLLPVITSSQNDSTISSENEKYLLPLEDEQDATIINKEKPIIAETFPITLPFSFNNEPISNIVNVLSHAKRINIIEPSDEIYKKITVTYSNSEEISIDDAWTLLQTFLKLGGYSLALRGKEYSIVQRTTDGKITGNIAFNSEVLPLYINQAPEDLPYTDAPIRAMFFIENLALPSAGSSGDAISAVLKDMLSPGSTPIFDSVTKSIILTDSANLIASVMKIIYALDQGGLRETVEIVPLYNTAANTIAAFLKEGLGIKGTSDTQPAYLGRTQRSEGHPYFASNTSIVAEDRMNALIILGREAQVDRLKQFIEEYIDVPPDKGESILHTYDLQYLDAETIAGTLSEIFAPIGNPSTGQSDTTATQAGPERYFQNPVIISEKYVQAAAANTITTASTGINPNLLSDTSSLTPYQGGNKLIVAATSHDWQRIYDLLQQIDVPNRNIIIEALVVDVSFADDKFLRGAIRNPKAMGLQDGQSFQNQNIPGAAIAGNALVYDGSATEATGDLSVDMLKKLAQSTENTLASFATQGSLVLSFQDPSKSGIWSLLEILQANEDFKILQHPSVVTTNNTTATIAFQEIRRDFGTVQAGSGGALTIPIVDVTAQLAISITPRTSSDDRVNLTIAVEISDFPNSSSTIADFDRRTRAVGTNVNMSDNQVVALGGLVSSTTSTGETQTPILSRIPLIGSFFRGTTKFERKTNLIVFISARIVEPRGKSHTKQYTQDKLARGIYHMDDEDLFTTLQDPITRVFFKKSWDEKHVINDFMLETEGSMLDPDTYTHEMCNDDKVAAKINFMESSKAHTNGQTTVKKPKTPGQFKTSTPTSGHQKLIKSGDMTIDKQETQANVYEAEAFKKLLENENNPLG